LTVPERAGTLRLLRPAGRVRNEPTANEIGEAAPRMPREGAHHLIVIRGMVKPEPLTEREHLILEAVIRSYVETAEPAGSRSVVRRFKLGLSPATVRNTMSDLEEKGYLYHPHTSAGRVPTDRAYRFFVDSLLGQPRATPEDERSLREELEAASERSAVEQLIRHAAQVLGLLTQELGIAVAPRLDEAVLERIELVSLVGGQDPAGARAPRRRRAHHLRGRPRLAAAGHAGRRSRRCSTSGSAG
jgi:hypothetical protein